MNLNVFEKVGKADALGTEQVLYRIQYPVICAQDTTYIKEVSRHLFHSADPPAYSEVEEGVTHPPNVCASRAVSFALETAEHYLAQAVTNPLRQHVPSRRTAAFFQLTPS